MQAAGTPLKKLGTVLALAAIAVGVVARFSVYLHDGVLTYDEALLRLALRGWSPATWLIPLGFEQTAAPMYLGLLHSVTGPGLSDERLMRLLPLGASLLILPVCYWSVNVLWSRTIALIATALLAFHSGLVGYAGIFKQYEMDALVAAVILGLAALIARRNRHRATWPIVLLTGGLAVMLSQPAIIGLFGLLAWVVIGILPVTELERRRHHQSWIAACGLIWVGLEGFLYLRLYAPVASSPFMRSFWAGSFVALTDIRDWVSAAHALFDSVPGGVVTGVLATLAGIVVLVGRKDRTGVLLLGPILGALVLALLHFYPVALRLWLFLSPACAVLMAVGTWAVCSAVARLVSRRFIGLWALALLAVAAVLGVYWAHGRLHLTGSAMYVLHRIRRPDASVGAAGERRAAELLLTDPACTPVYVAARAVAKWYFFTSRDSLEAARFNAMRSISRRDSPGFGDAPPSALHLPDSARRFQIHVGCREEVYGLASGTPFENELPRADARVPVAGWAQNEIGRALAAGHDGFYLYLDGAGPFAIRALQDELDRRELRYQSLEPGIPVYQVRRK